MKLSDFEMHTRVHHSVHILDSRWDSCDLYTLWHCSYKEDSDDQTDSDDLIEVTQDQQEAEEEDDNKEIIEKVLDDRIGRPAGKPCNKKGSLGGTVDLYLIFTNLDLNLYLVDYVLGNMSLEWIMSIEFNKG